MKTLGRAMVVAALAVGGLASPALANSDYSSRVGLPNSDYLQSYVYISSNADSDGCGSYQGWSRIVKGTPSWVSTATRFTEDGFGSLTVSGLTGTHAGTDVTIRWKNSNGAKGAYLSGGVCMSALSWYTHAQTTGAVFVYGTTRTSATKVL